MTVVMVYDKRYMCLFKTLVTHRHVTTTILIVHTLFHSFNKLYKKLYIIFKVKIYNILHTCSEAWESTSLCFQTHPIHDTARYHKELTSMMQTWLMNKAACPSAVKQEPDNTLNLVDVDFWLWYQKVTLDGMALLLLDLFYLCSI